MPVRLRLACGPVFPCAHAPSSYQSAKNVFGEVDHLISWMRVKRSVLRADFSFLQIELNKRLAQCRILHESRLNTHGSQLADKIHFTDLPPPKKLVRF